LRPSPFAVRSSVRGGPIVVVVDGATGLALALAAGAVVGVVATLVVVRRSAAPEPTATADASQGVLNDLARLLQVLPGAAFIVGPDDSVLRASSQAAALGIVQGRRIDIPEIRALVAAVRRDGVIREEDVELRRPPLGKGVIHARVRVATLSPTAALVIVEDLSCGATSSPTSRTRSAPRSRSWPASSSRCRPCRWMTPSGRATSA